MMLLIVLYVLSLSCSVYGFFTINKLITDKERQSRNYAEWILTLSDEDAETVERLYSSFNSYVLGNDGNKRSDDGGNNAK